MTAKEFILNLPAQVNPDALTGIETLFHFDIAGDNGGEFTVEVTGGKVNATEGLSGDPKCVVKAKDETLIGIIKGDVNPMMAVLTGKLKISNQGELLKYAKLFGLM